MQIIKPILLMSVLAGLLSSCGRSARNSLSVGDSERAILDGEQLKEIHDERLERLDLIGLQEVRLWGEYLMFMTNDTKGNIRVYDKRTLDPIGKYFPRGNGPGELAERISFSDILFDGSMAYVNNYSGGLIDWDIKKSCELGKTVCTNHRGMRVSDAGYLTSVIPVRDNALACVEMVTGGQNRFLFKNGKRIVQPNQQRLNDVRVSSNDRFRTNILFGFATYDKVRNRMVEASTMLNTIQLYDLDGEFAKTVNVGSKSPDDVSEVEKLPLAKLPLLFQSMRSWDRGFGLIYYGSTMEDFQKRASKPAILLFDWDGNMMSCLNVPVWITSFDVDWDSKWIYAVDQEHEKLYKFALPS